MKTHDFDEMVAHAKRAERQKTEAAIIQRILPDCVYVKSSAQYQDANGIYHVAGRKLKSGLIQDFYIDAKWREKGCSAYWSRYPRGSPLRATSEKMPEFALEPWAKKPTLVNENNVVHNLRELRQAIRQRSSNLGWTLDTRKQTHYVLFIFSPADHNKVYLVRFRALRRAFVEHLEDWLNDPKCSLKTQKSVRGHGPGGEPVAWESMALFVPAQYIFDNVKYIRAAEHIC
jgi:hypothetical protein